MKKFKRRLLLSLLPPFGAFLMRLIYFSCKKRFFLPSSLPTEPFIVAFWHGSLFMQPFLYRKIRKKPKIAVMISEHFDGEIIAKTIASFGFVSIRGSSRRGGAKVLIAALRKHKEGYDIAITPDGPKGPCCSVAPGIVVLAKKSDSFIVPFSWRASRYWELKSWDHFKIPKPFCTIEFFCGEPFKVTDMAEDEAKEFIKKQMLQ